MGPRAGLDRCGKSRPPQGFDLPTVKLVASRHTDSAIPVHAEHDIHSLNQILQTKYHLRVYISLLQSKLHTATAVRCKCTGGQVESDMDQ